MPSRPASPLYVAVGVACSRRGRRRGRAHARHADDAAPAEGRCAGKPPVPQGLTGPGRARRSRRRSRTGRTGASTRCSGSGSSTRREDAGRAQQSASCSSTAGSRCSGPATRRTRRPALETAKKLGRDTIDPGPGRQPAPPEFFQPTSGPSYPVFIPLSEEPAAPAGLAAAGAGPPDLGRAALPAGGASRARTTSRRRSRRRSASSTRTT